VGKEKLRGYSCRFRPTYFCKEVRERENESEKKLARECAGVCPLNAPVLIAPIGNVLTRRKRSRVLT